MAWWAIAIAIVSAGASYIQAKKAAKKAKEMTEGVEANIESNSKEIPVVYGERRVGGTRVYIDTSRDRKHQYLYMVIAMAEGEVESITDIKIDDIPVSDSRFITSGNKQNLWYDVFTGTDNQTVSTLIKQGTQYDTREDVWVDPYQQYHDTDIGIPEVTYPWGDDHKLSGIAYIALKFKWDENAYTGIPDVTAVVKGRKVYNPDTGVTEWSDNPALCIRDYLTNERFGKGLPASAIDDAAFIQAANDLDNFTITPYTGAGSTQKLFRMNHVVDTSKKIMENLNDMIIACRGFIPYSNGVYSLKIDQTSSSVLSIGADQIISGIAISGARKEDRFNQVKVNFYNAASEYKEDQAIYPEQNSTLYQQYLTEDEGEPLVDEVDLYSINNYYSAREMARLFLERSRQNMTIAFQGTSELINLEVGEVVSITHPTPEWVDKLFQVQEVALAFDGTVQITCIEYDAALYTYDEPDEEQPYVGTRLPDPNQVDPPTALSTTTGTYLEEDGKAIGYIDLSWNAPEDSLVDRYELKFEYSNREEVIELASTEYRFKPTQDNVGYIISVRAVNGLGIRSDWVTAQEVVAVVDTTAPADITGGSVTGGLNQLTLSWTNPSDNDFDLVKIKVGDDNNVNNAIELASTRSDTFIHDINTYETTKYYWGAPVDRTGNVGNYVSIGSATTGRPSYDDLNDKPEIPVVPEVATTAYLTLSDSNAPTDTEFNTAVGRDPIENDFVVVSYTVETVTNTKAYVYKTVSPATVPDWTEVTEYIDGSMLVTGSLSASDITTGTLNANDVTISNLTVSYDSQVSDKPTIPTNVSELLNDSGFIDNTDVVFSDDLGDYIRLDSVENLLLSFDKYADQETDIDWTGYSSPTSDIKVVKSADSVTGGSYLEIGNNDGNDEGWLIHDRNIPFDPSQTYRVTVRVKQTAGVGKAYLGFAGVASDGTTFVNYAGNNSFSSQHFFAGANTDIPSTWTEYVGYVKGVGPTGTTEQRSDYNNPAVMHEDTRFVRPLILVNYSNKAGITLIDSFKIEAISANPNAIQGNEVDANVTEISGGVIQAGSQITVGTGNNIGALSGSDSTFRIWAGHATASSAPFRVSQAGVLNATGAVIDGNVTAQSLDVENATVTGTFIAPIGWSESVYSGVINRGNLNESVKDLIDERIAEVTGGISGDFGQDDGSFSYIAQGNPDPVDPTVENITHENGKDLTVELSGSRSWNRQFIGLPDTDMGVTIILERSPAGADTWTTLTTLTDSGSSITTSGPTLIHSSTYAYSISIYHVLTDDQASGNYDYRARTTVAGSAYSVGVPIQLTVVEPATVGAGNADTLDNEDGTYYLNYNNFTNTPTIPDVSGKADLSGDTFTGIVRFNTNSNTTPVKISRGNTNGQNLDIGVDDTVARFTYTNDESASGMFFRLINTDTESNGGASANEGNINFNQNSNGTSITVNGSEVYHTGNFTNNSSNWDTAYTYSQVGHLPLSGGSVSGIINLEEGEDEGLRVADNKIRSVGDSLIFNSDGIRFGTTSANWDYDEWAGLKYYHPSKTIYFGGARASTSYWENNLGDANDTKIDFVGVTDLSRNGTTFLDSDDNATFNKATISGKIQMEPDDTYTNYYAIGFQGTNTANGVNKIFAHGTGAGGMFVCSATSQSIYFRANGSSNNTFTMTSSGNFQLDDTTVIDASRNAYFTGARLASGNNLEWGGAYSNGYPTIASNSSGASGIMVFYPTGNTDGEIARLDTSGLSVTGDTNVSGMIRAGLGTSNSQSTVARFGGASQGGEINALSLVNSVTAELGNAVSINFHNANVYSPTGKIVTVQRGASVTDSSIEIHGYDGGLQRQVEIDYLGNFDLQRGGYQVNGTTVIDTSRNIKNVGTVSSGVMYPKTTNGSAVGGGIFLAPEYNGTNPLTSDHIPVMSTSYSSGGLIIGYGAAGKAGSGANTFTSTFDNFSGYRSAVKFLGDEVAFWGTTSATQTAVGSDLTMQQGLSINVSTGTIDVKHGGYQIGGTTVIDSSGNLTNIGTITSGRINCDEIYNQGWFRNYNSGQGLYNQANAMHWYSEDNTGYSIYSVEATTEIKFKTAGNITRGYVYADNLSNIGFLNSTGGWTLRCDDSRNVSITNKLSIGGKFQFEEDDTYNGYYTIGFQGTNTANGVNKIFAHGAASDGIYICSATSRHIHFRTNGSGNNTFRMTAQGQFQLDGTTVIDGSRNVYPNVIDMGSGHAQGYKFHGRSYSWNSAMQTPTTKMPHIWQEDYNGWDPVIGIKTTSGFWQMGAYSSDRIHFGYMAGAYGGHSSNSFDTSWAFTPTTFKIGDVGTMNLIVSGNITAYSDRRLKDDIETLDGSKVYQMRGVSFTKDGEKGSGVIAQELEQVAPELVLTNDDEMETKSVAYGNIVGYLIEAIKELKHEIEELKNGTNSN